MSRDEPAFRMPEDWAGQEAGQRREQARQRRRAAQEYRDAFAGAAGGRVLNDLIARFAGESYCRGDPHHTAYREGQRSVVEHIARALAQAQTHAQQDNKDDGDE